MFRSKSDNAPQERLWCVVVLVMVWWRFGGCPSAVNVVGLSLWLCCGGCSVGLDEGKVDGENQQCEGYEVVPMERFAAEAGDREDGEDGERDDFLNDFQLNEREWPAVAYKSEAVGWHLARVFG